MLLMSHASIAVVTHVSITVVTRASIAVVKIACTPAFAGVTIAVVETTREASGLRELVLRRRFEVVVGGWIWEVRFDSGGAVVVDDG